MLTIALTGGIGSGKSTVCRLFQEIALQHNGNITLKIIDADQIAGKLLSGALNHSLNHSKPSALTEVYHLFGSKLFNQGKLDRVRLRQLIFSSTKKKQQLESLLHPKVYQAIFAEIQTYKQQYKLQSKKLIIIIAVPLLFETQAENKFDRILVIDTSVELQIVRSTKRDHCSETLIKKIIHSQVDRQTRLNSADDIINNSETFDSLHQQIEELFRYYLSLLEK